jgi:uncharacterized tellurite resistance protein B-like protein
MSEREFVLQLAENEVAALVEVMFLAAESDGDVSGSELAHLSAEIVRVTSGGVDRERADSLVEAARGALSESNRAARLSHVKGVLDPGKRRHALLLAIQVTAADGRLRTSERELILQTAEALDIDGDTAADMVAVVTSSTP